MSDDNFSIIRGELSKYGGRQKQAGEYRMVVCPFHADGTPSCGIYLRKDHPSKTLGFYNCLAAETRVITFNGVKPIKSLIGKKTWVITRGDKWVQTTFKEYGKQRLYKITLERNRSIKVLHATADHRWFVDGFDHRSENARAVGETTTRNLRAGGYLEQAVPPQAHIELDNVGIQHGFVYGDGTLSYKHAVAYFCGEKLEMKKYFKEYKKYRYSSESRDQINKLPAEWKALPSLDSEDSYLMGFLAGLIAADGCVTKGGTIMLHNRNKKVIEVIQDIALRLGITVQDLKHRMRETNYTHGKREPLSHIYFTKAHFPKELLLRSKHRERYSQSGKARLRWKVKAVEKTSRKETVYCCEIPETQSFALEGYILTGNCLGCGAHGQWNAFAEKTGLQTVKAWNGKEKTIEYSTARDEDALLGDAGITMSAVYKSMGCPEAQPWPIEMDWRGVDGSLIAAVGGKAINDERNDGIAVLFPIKIGKRIRGAVKAMFQKKTATQLGYITMAGEWVKQFGLFPYSYTVKLIRRNEYKFVILVEGPRDALRLLKLGLPAIAILGANTIGKTKMLYITNLGVDQVYVMPDNDRGGSLLWKNIKRLLPDARRLKLPRERGDDGKVIKMDPFSAPYSILKAVKVLMAERHGWVKEQST